MLVSPICHYEIDARGWMSGTTLWSRNNQLTINCIVVVLLAPTRSHSHQVGKMSQDLKGRDHGALPPLLALSENLRTLKTECEMPSGSLVVSKELSLENKELVVSKGLASESKDAPCSSLRMSLLTHLPQDNWNINVGNADVTEGCCLSSHTVQDCSTECHG